MNRRAGIMSLLAAGLFSASCTQQEYALRTGRSLYQALGALRTGGTVAEFEQTIGYRGTILRRSQSGPANPSMYLQPSDTVRRDRNYWERLFVFSHPDLLEMIEVSTKLIAYSYRPNFRASGNLCVFADDNDRVIGWMYSRVFVGNEREAISLDPPLNSRRVEG
jgi:hypothetical protein